jgi:exodeoxyribonuclease V beta subunit
MGPRHYRRPEIIAQIPLDRHCVIEASAGTGKTFTIEHLAIEVLLNSETRLDQMLAVTFTEKAAAELRARIRQTIEKTLRGASTADEAIGDRVPLDEEKARRLEAALFAFERAPIHTIHSFCHRMLTDLAFPSGTRFAVEVADARAMFHEAFRAELRERFASDEWMRGLLEEWLADDEDADSLESLLFSANRRRYIESGAPERNTAAMNDLLAAKVDPELLTRALLEAGLKKPALANLAEIEQALKRSGRDPWRLRRELQSENLTKVGNLPHPERLPPRIRAFARSLRLAEYAVTLEARLVDAFLPSVAERLARLKRERGLIDFDDMPGWLWSALEGPQGEELAAMLRERFHLGLIDEFQDTDDLQWRIFRRIFVEGAGSNRLVVIGDPKQAIYAFRDADVFTYLAAKRELIDSHSAGYVPLTRNFRATVDMIDAINLIFAEKPDPAFFASGEIRYDNPVTCGRPELTARQNGRALKPVTLLKLPDGAKRSAPRCRALLGRRIAAALKDLLDGAHAIEVAGPDAKTIKAGDIFVLTRTLMESREMAAFLREAGVPYAFYKQDGLFQTREAGHVLDVLRAIAEPLRRSNRLKAWSTPFFGVAMRDLPGLDDVPPSHPLMARLLDWKALAEREHFEDLFAAMMGQSGLAARELLLSDTQRELTNYEHIFEILLERAFADQANLADLIRLLAGWVEGDDLPPGENPGVQRLDSERDAIQIMTVHKSKGLEAEVVVLFGGYMRGFFREKVAVFHSDDERQVVAGAGARKAASTQIEDEERAEEERLLYVALTRAKAKLYLALFPDGSTLRPLNGYYRHLNERLKALCAEDEKHRRKLERLTEIVPVNPDAVLSADSAKVGAALISWMPPEAMLSDEGDHTLAQSRNDLVARHPALAIDSYTSLQRRAELRGDVDHSSFKYDPDSGEAGSPGLEDLAGGRAVGIFLHEVIERLDLDHIAAAKSLEAWRREPAVRAAIETAARRHQVPLHDLRLDRAAEIVFNALRSPITMGAELVPALAGCSATREMEFTFPIPARDHPLLGANHDGDWKIERGLFVGFVDFVFRFRNRTCFADWKSDLLPSYDPAVIAEHVAAHYLIQARIYTIGIVRLLRIRTRAEYEQRFGGLLYVFIRGVKPSGDGRAGVYFHRPDWDEVVAYERSLMTPAESGARRP